MSDFLNKVHEQLLKQSEELNISRELQAKIKELRKSGNLDEALKLAVELLQQYPDNVWNKRSLAWVYYEFIKKHSNPDSYEVFKEFLGKLRELKLPDNEQMVYDLCAWQIGKMVFALQRKDPVDYGKINDVFEIIKEFHFTKPNDSYSFIYKSFHGGYKNWSNYLEFADWWNFENFEQKDYLEEEYKGKKKMSLVERAFIAYSKKLLDGDFDSANPQQRKINKAKIQSFLPQLEIVINEYPNYQYPPYFKAKLLLVLGEENNVLSAFLPFAKLKKNDFWVWELMAEIFNEDKGRQFACYCKALSLNTPEDFLVKLRQAFAAELVDENMYVEAKTEIEKVVATRNKHQWKLPPQVSEWIQKEWYSSVEAKRDNKDLYGKYVKEAEEILYHDIPEEIIVVEYVNENKHMLNFVKNKRKHGFFKYQGYLNKPIIGDVLKVKFIGEGKDDYFKIVSARKIDSDTVSEAIRDFEGVLKVIQPHNFGFVEDVFFEPKLIQQKNLSNGQIINGKALMSFNKKKEEWGWKAINFEN